MNIEELGSLGEFVGAIAVLVTLVYLAIQTRHTRTAAELTAKTAVMNTSSSVLVLYSKWRELILNNPHVEDALIRANSNMELDETDNNTVTHLFHELFITGAFSYTASRGFGAIHERSTDVDYIVKILGTYPCGVKVWDDFRLISSAIDPEYSAALDAALKDSA